MRSWNLHEIETPSGSRSPVVLDSDDAARVVLIGLDPGQALGEHQVKEHAFVLVVDGTVRVESGGESLEAPSGTLFTFEPDERRSVSTDWNGFWLAIQSTTACAVIARPSGQMAGCSVKYG